MNFRMTSVALVAALVCVPMVAAGAAPPFSQGTVWSVTEIKVKDGHFTDYVKWLANVWKPQEEALERGGYIIGYKVLSTVDARTGEPNLLLCQEYKNMAAFDVPVAKMYAFAAKQFGSVANANKGEISRRSIRKVMGSVLYREIVLK